MMQDCMLLETSTEHQCISYRNGLISVSATVRSCGDPFVLHKE